MMRCFRTFSTPAFRFQGATLKTGKQFSLTRWNIFTVTNVAAIESKRGRTSVGSRATSDASQILSSITQQTRLSHHSKQFHEREVKRPTKKRPCLRYDVSRYDLLCGKSTKGKSFYSGRHCCKCAYAGGSALPLRRGVPVADVNLTDVDQAPKPLASSRALAWQT